MSELSEQSLEDCIVEVKKRKETVDLNLKPTELHIPYGLTIEDLKSVCDLNKDNPKLKVYMF